MNRIFKIIWSKSKRTYIVVSEFANSCGGKKKLTASVLAFVMGISAGTGFVSAWSRSEENLMAEVMKRIDAKYVQDGRNITIGQETESGLNSITIGRMARAAYSRPGNEGWENRKATYALGGENKNAVAIGTNSLAGAANIASIIPANETTYFNYSSIANLPSQVVYYRTQMTKIKDPNQKGISERYYGEGDIKVAAKGDGGLNLYDVVRDSGTDQVAVGHHSRAIGDQAISIGSNSMAGRYSVVIGGNSFGDKNDAESFYKMYLDNNGIFRTLSGYRWIDSNPKNEVEGSTYAGEASVAIGTKAHAMTPLGTAVGAMARIEQNSLGAVALGAGSSVGSRNAGHDSIGAVAIGMGSAAKGIGSIALGARAMIWPKAGGVNRITAIGYGTVANNEDSVALGSLAEADRGSDMAGYFYGYKAATIDKSKEAGSIQLKLKDGAKDLIENYEVKVTPSAWEVPKATETDIEKGFRTHVYEGLKGPALKANAGALSIGKKGSTPDAVDAITRQIVNVAAGTNDTDAVNVAQLRNVNMMIEADSAGAGTPKAFSDFLLDNARLKISGQSYLSTELTQDKEGPRITLKAKTTELVSNQDGTYTTKNNEDGLITAGELVKRMNAAKKERDNLEKKIGELVYLNDKGEKLQQKDGKFFKVNPDGSLDESKEETPAAITSKRPGLQLANVNGAVTQLTPDGLADLSNIPKTTGVNVDDISKIGWILSVPKDNYSEAVTHNRKVSFFGNDLAKVTGAGKGEDPRKITVTVDRKETGKAVEQEFLNNGFTQIRYVDANNKPLVRAQDGKYYYPVSPTDDTPNTKKGAVEPAARMADVESHPTVLSNVKHGADVINKTGDPTDGLADLSKDSQRSNVATVEDLHNLGFVIKGKADDDSAVTGQVKHANTVEFAGEDLAKVITESKDGKHKVTVKVNKDDVAQAVNAANAQKGATPTTYVDKDGNPLVKGDDGNYYKVKDDGTPDKDGGTADPAGVRLGEKDTPVQLTNVKPGTNEITAEGPTKGLADLAKAVPGTVATVDDLKKMGFVVADGANYHATVANAQTVKFVGEGLATVTGETKDNIRTFTVKVDKEEVAKAINAEGAKKGTAPTTYVDKDGNPLVKDGDKYYKPKADGTPDTTAGAVDPAGVRLGEKDKPMQLTNVAPATEAINKPNDPTNGLADLAKAKDGTVATVADLKKLGFVVSAGDNYSEKVQHAQEVNFKGEGLAEVSGKTDGQKRIITVKVDDKKVADAVKSINDKAGNAPTQYVDKDGNPLVKAKDGKYYPKDKVGDDGQPKPDAKSVDPTAIQVGEKGKPAQLTNVKPGTNEITAEGPTKGLADLEHAVPGTVATVDDLKKLGFIIKGTDTAGKPVSGQVKHTNTVEFAGEDLAKVITESKDGVSKVTVKVNKEEIAKAVNAENAKKGSEPTTYVDENGNPLVKDGDKYYKPKADGTPDKDAGEKTPAGVRLGEKDKPMQLTNVAPATKAIDKENDPTKGLADLKNAKDGTVATVADLKKLGFVVADGGNYHATVTNAQTVKFVGEGLATVTGETKDNVRTFTVKVDDKKVADAVKSINDKAGNAPTQYVDKDGNPLVKVGDKYYPKDKVGDDGQLKPDAQAVEPAGIQVGEKGKPTQLTNVAPATKAIDKPNDPTNGLADLANAKDGTVATVADLKNLGFVIKGKAADGTTDVSAQVKHANIVEFAGEDLAKVITESANGASKVTVKVNKEDIVKVVNDANDKKGSAPTQYVDKDGNPLVKDGDKYYKQNPDGTPNKGEGEKTPAGIKVGEKDTPMQLDNVARGTETKPVNGKDGQPIMGSDNQPLKLVDLKDAKDTKVATVGDLKDMGFVLGASVNAAGGEKAYYDVVKNGNKVRFEGLGGAWISGKTDQDGTRVITIDVNADNLVTGTQNAVQYVNGEGKRMIPILQTGKEVLYYNAADNPVKHKMPNSDKEAIYKLSDIAEDGTLKPDAQPLQGKKAGDVSGLGVALVDPNGSAETDKGTVLRNVGEGTATIAAPTDDKDTVGKAKAGLADLANSKDTNGLSVADAKKLGWVISTGKDGKDFAEKVQTADEVNFQGEENGPITVKGSADGSKRIVTIGVDAKKMAAVVKSELDKSGDSNVQYVDKDGKPLVKVGDKYYTKDQLKDDGQPKDGAKDSKPAAQKLAGAAPMQLKNVAPGTKSIEAPKEADAKPVDKAKAGLADLSVPKDAAKDTDAKNTAATVDDLRRMGWVLSTGDDYAEKVQNANEINFKGVDGITITGKTDSGKRIVSVGVDAQAVIEHADIPIVYKDEKNNPVTKIGNDFYTKPENSNDAPVFVPGENGQKGAVYKKSDLGNDGKPKAEAKPLTPVDNDKIKTALNGKDPRVLSNVAPGTEENDAATYGQVKKIADGVQKAVSDMSNAVSEVGSDAAALAGLQPLQYDPLEPTQVMAAIGGYRGSNSVALGVAHYTNESTMLHAGITFGGNSMFNIGLTKKFGHSDEERMIPQRYRSGPISSVYVMQDEVSKLKAENEQQKQEIKELREMVMALMGEKKK
ncbi:ESPR-type extended signal peptide-containing protein [Dialister micraerophilus]|uniref:Hep/Hag repeat protein n=2 Tax=Dialister micraerophilus TaxID=309120 RepID=E4LA15_9FIRM|nr:ESPR-type extended signal peptide-containing protein [Dialister micraerophilus]EFR42379.1 Hep/Hag repeat protein [Dialister micraerophilus UPII 345-E]